jgi:hypothetical protein|tara:strand:+ start:2899 stop:3072 length:174 start_codon:yes stop_codon:yes gene_type:complete
MNEVVRGLMGNDFFLASLCYLLVVVPTLGIAYVHRPKKKVELSDEDKHLYTNHDEGP